MIPDKSDNIEIDDDIKLEPYELNDQFSTWDTWYSTLRRFKNRTLEVRFIFSLSFRTLGLAFNLEYLSDFFINFNNQ